MDCFGTGHILITRVLLDPSINKSKKEGRAIERADELINATVIYQTKTI